MFTWWGQRGDAIEGCTGKVASEEGDVSLTKSQLQHGYTAGWSEVDGNQESLQPRLRREI